MTLEGTINESRPAALPGYMQAPAYWMSESKVGVSRFSYIVTVGERLQGVGPPDSLPYCRESHAPSQGSFSATRPPMPFQ